MRPQKNLQEVDAPWVPGKAEEQATPTKRRWWPIPLALAILITASFLYYKHITRVPEAKFKFLQGLRPVRSMVTEESPLLWVLYHVKKPVEVLQQEAKRELAPPAWEYRERKLGDILAMTTREREDGVLGYFINKGRAPAGVESPTFDGDGDPNWSHVMIAYRDPMPVWIRELTYRIETEGDPDVPSETP